MLLNDAPRVGKIPILSDRSEKRRSAESVVWYLVSVAFVAVSTIVLFSVASVSILAISKETLTGSRIDNRTVEDKSIGTVFFYTDSSAVPVSVQAQSPSSSEANSLLSSTPAPQSSGMQRGETEAKPSPNPPPDGGLSAAAVEIPHGSTQGPSTDVHNFEIQRNDHGNIDHRDAAFGPEKPEANNLLSSTPAPPPSGMQREETEAKPSPNPPPDGGLSAAAVEIPHGSTLGPSTDVHNFEIQRNDHGNIDQGNAAFAPEEPEVMESTGYYGSTVSPGSPPLRHAASHHASAAEGDHNITEKLNRAELSRLLKGSQASRR